HTPGLGSAIFLHVSTGGSTAGCVSLPSTDLVALLRWLDPAQQPRIVMGTPSDVGSERPLTTPPRAAPADRRARRDSPATRRTAPRAAPVALRTATRARRRRRRRAGPVPG